MKRVLLVTYPFPPVGGAGVQRVTKFVKYLPRYDWQASVLTVANPSVPTFDRSLLSDVPADALICRARTLEPGYGLKSVVSASEENNSRRAGMLSGAKLVARRLSNLILQPDPQVLWMPGALAEGKRLLRRLHHDAIIASGPPFSTFLIGASLSRHSGLPLVLDYRDEWTISNAHLENKHLGPFSARVQRMMQNRVVRQADSLVATTACSARALSQICEEARSRARVTWIYNGFDAPDFAGPPPVVQRNGHYRLAYVGTLWELTSVQPLVEAVRRLAARQPELAARLELVFAGRRTAAQQQILDRLSGLRVQIVQHPYIDHDGALDLIRTADGLCVLLSNFADAARVVPAKIFEYMAARRPILAIAPPGELWDLVRDYPIGRAVTPGDVEGIVASLVSEIQRYLDGREPYLNGWNGSRYERCTQAGQLANLLDSLVYERQAAL